MLCLYKVGGTPGLRYFSVASSSINKKNKKFISKTDVTKVIIKSFLKTKRQF